VIFTVCDDDMYSGGCKSLSGTSVASPVVAGAVTLLLRWVWLLLLCSCPRFTSDNCFTNLIPDVAL